MSSQYEKALTWAQIVNYRYYGVVTIGTIKLAFPDWTPRKVAMILCVYRQSNAAWEMKDE